LPEGALKAWQAAIEANPGAEIITGSAEAVRSVGDGVMEREWRKIDALLKELNVDNLALGEPMINARTIRKSLFKKVGPFDLAYSLASDRDFLLKLAREAPVNVAIEAMTYRYRWHEGSRTMNAGNSLSRRLTAENLAIARKHLADPSWGAEDKRALAEWHSHQSLQAAMCAIEAFDPVGFLSVIPTAMRRDPTWLFAFAGEFAYGAMGWVKRGFKTRSQLSFQKTHKIL
jgi:hypothetical protein